MYAVERQHSGFYSYGEYSLIVETLSSDAVFQTVAP